MHGGSSFLCFHDFYGMFFPQTYVMSCRNWQIRKPKDRKCKCFPHHWTMQRKLWEKGKIDELRYWVFQNVNDWCGRYRTACGIPVCPRLGGWLATTLVATLNTIFFPFFPLSTFLIEGALGSKNLFRESWWERPKT